MKKTDCYTHSEGVTGGGQLLEFTCPPEKVAEVKEFLKNNVRSIDIPMTGRVNLTHGTYGQYTRYEIVQHKYAGGGYPGCGGYIEVLEIKNPPDNRQGFIIHEHDSNWGTAFTEWETLEDARLAFAGHWSSNFRDNAESFPKLSGFKRRIACGLLKPWFYAVGNQQLIGDYAFPEGLQDDPVYRFGQKFVVFNEFDDQNIPIIKTCMGTRFVEETKGDPYHQYSSAKYRLVYWNDGSVWNEEHASQEKRPRPLGENELWIEEAIREFCKLLAGRKIDFSINFLDGSKFIGKWLKMKLRAQPSSEGNYYCIVHFKGIARPREGWIVDFKPTPETPSVVVYINQESAKRGEVVERLEIKKCKPKAGGKKWVGVWNTP